MKLAVSNIAWSKDEEPAIATLLKDLGVNYIELAPTKQWSDPTITPDDEIQAYKDWWASYGIDVVAFQSMLFNRPDLKIFESPENRAECLNYLQEFVVLAGKMGARTMVFGSPKNRQRTNLDIEQANATAAEFFTTIGTTAKENGVYFCIEPNAIQYACDFVTNASEGIELVKKVNTDGFGLHLDIACMTLAGDDITKSITEAAPLLQHFHISSPMLETVEDRSDVHHSEAAAALRKIGYDKFVSIEMKPGEDSAIDRVKKAVLFAQQVYSS